MKKHLFVAVFSVFLALSSFFYTEREAKALVPLIAGGLAAMGVDMTTVGLLTAVGLGTTLAAITASKSNSTSGGATYFIPINPQTPLPTPPGWTAPVAPSVDPTPPASATPTSNAVTQPAAVLTVASATQYQTAWGPLEGFIYATPTAACQADCQHQAASVGTGGNYCISNSWASGGQCGGTCKNGTCTYGGYTQGPGCPSGYSMVSGVCTKYQCPDASWSLSGTTCSQAATCPAGYSNSGGSCVLADATKVQKPGDNYCGIKRVGNTFAADANDPDCRTYGPGAGSQPDGTNVTQPAPNQIVISDPSTFTQATITLNPDGTTTTTFSGPSNEVARESGVPAPANASNTTTTTQTNTLSAPDASTGKVAVTGQQQTVTQGTGTQSTSTPAIAGQTVVPQQVTVNFPSDYARQGEAAAAAGVVSTHVDGVKTSVDAVKKSVDSLSDVSGAAQDDPVVPATSAMDNAFFKGVFDSLLVWQVPGHSSQCPNLVLDYDMWSHHTHISTDAICVISENVRSVFQLVMVCFWTIVALFIILEA